MYVEVERFVDGQYKSITDEVSFEAVEAIGKHLQSMRLCLKLNEELCFVFRDQKGEVIGTLYVSR